jgi:dTDP-4-dehydrorhamnose reductase
VTRVLVLGINGMLGSMVADVLSASGDHEVAGTLRPGAERPPVADRLARVADLDAQAGDVGPVLDELAPEWIVNAIGIIKPRIDESDPESVRRAIDVNGRFPYELADAAAARGARVIQIATDCVYSGRDGGYAEDAPHDALDVYGKSKSLGEAPTASVVHLRCSIIGPELTGHASLLDWALGQEQGGQVNGFTNHLWNGVTTYQFARVCEGVMRGSEPPASPLHVVPGDVVTKDELLRIIYDAYDRPDVTINPGPAAVPVDRSLATQHAGAVRDLWAASGYDEPPTVASMVSELARHSAQWTTSR